MAVQNSEAALESVMPAIPAGRSVSPEMFFEMGLICARGRDGAPDPVAAHKWLNIAAIRGCDRAAELRAEIAGRMSKADIAAALKSARDWMTAECRGA